MVLNRLGSRLYCSCVLFCLLLVCPMCLLKLISFLVWLPTFVSFHSFIVICFVWKREIKLLFASLQQDC